MRHFLRRAVFGFSFVVVFAACVAPARPVPPPDLPPDALMFLDQKFHPGQVVRTNRVFTAVETHDDGRTTEVWREDVYRTLVEQVDPQGRPTAAIRTYDRALFRVDGPDGKAESASAIEGQSVVFRPGMAPTVDGADVDESLAMGLTLQSFETMFLPDFEVWEGAQWSPARDQLEPLNRFLRSLGLVPDRNEITIAWERTREIPAPEAAREADPNAAGRAEPPAHRAAILSVSWRSSGLLATPTGRQKPARVIIEGSMLFDIDAGMVTSLSLRGVNPAANATFNISLSREILPPDQSPLVTPKAPATGGADDAGTDAGANE